ncbi:Restriction endonuclease [Roseovarius albus]|uniref:Restriction endonuclease n=1 Tax=Roseovarius albus TaxID=1247867 RepID=A0A1X7A0F2_9RHOB|nr:restriction endonuclease [Roseovarius albus]SLN67009.1 Restriction endonuclease [Roseovarius albus]
MVGMGLNLGLGLSNSNPPAVTKETLESLSHELILPMELLSVVGEVDDGRIVNALINPWQTIFEQLEQNPNLLYEFSKNHRKFEEFIAGAYENAGFDKVVLTPASGDLGRDVIAEKHGLVTIRVLDQCKAFSKGRLVSANDVRAMMGTFYREPRASRAVVSTTSDFAPGIWQEWKDHIGNDLELRNGTNLIEWMKQFKLNS